MKIEIVKVRTVEIQTLQINKLILFLFLLIVLCSSCSMFNSISIGIKYIPGIRNDYYWLNAFELTSNQINIDSTNPRAYVFYIQGSDCNTTLKPELLGSLASPVILGCRVFLLEKRGVIGDSVNFKECYDNDTKEIRVADEITLIKQIIKSNVHNKPVILIGGSEGGDIASAVASKEVGVTHLVLLGTGGGWSQYDEFSYFIKKNGNYIGLSSIHSLDSIAKLIKSDKNSTKLWAGLPYKRWNSFMFDTSATVLTNSKIPIFLAHGSKDINVPVESAREFNQYFKKIGKTNLEYIEYENLDHRFYNDVKKASCFPYLEVDLINWFYKNGIVTQEEKDTFTKRVKKHQPELFN